MSSLPPPPPLPKSLDQLGPWRVWADQLIEAGDKLGTYLSTELGLGPSPQREQLVRFRRFAHSTCRVPRVFEPTWLLGHVRHLTLLSRERGLGLRRRPPVLDGGDLLTLRDTLAAPRLQHLESFEFSTGADGLRRRWREAVSRFPASCRTVVLHAAGYTSEAVEAVLGQLPERVTHLRLEPSFGTAPEDFVNDRLEWLDLRSVRVTRELSDRLAIALARTSRVRVLLGDLSGELGSRAVIGGAGDARLFDEQTGSVRLLERSRLSSLQWRFGVISVFGQLLRGVPETWDFEGGAEVRLTSWAGDTFTRRADGSWWVRQCPTATPTHRAVVVDGAPASEQIVPLANGARVIIEGRVWRFSSERRAD